MRSLLVIYDGNCRFCRASMHVALWAARPPGVRVVPFDAPRAVSVLACLPAPERHGSVHCLDGNRLYSGTEAFGVLLSRLHGGAFLLRTGTYRIYPWIVRNRTRLGRLVPDLPPPG